MDWSILLSLIFPICVSGLFTVEVDKSTYKSEFGGDVVMGCSFQPLPPANLTPITVTWHWISPGGPIREVYRMENGLEKLNSQHQDFQGRARLLTNELQKGWAKLQISQLRISDSGTYQCFVQTQAGADFKPITLSVFAPFKNIHKSIEEFPNSGKVRLTCQSKGYPASEVSWRDGQNNDIKPETAIVTTADQLIQITSQINVTSSAQNNYTCVFTDHKATFYIPDDIQAPAENNNTLIVGLCLAVTLAAIIVIVAVCKCQKKGPSTASTRNLLVDGLGRVFAFPAGNPKVTINDEERTIMNHSTSNDGLKTLLKEKYSEWTKALEKHHLDVDELCCRLYDNDGQQLTLQDLVPANGEVLFLEGPAGSGKTTISHTLVHSWTEPSVQAASHFDLSQLQLLVYVDGSSTKGDLFQEITKQLSLNEVLLAKDLRTMLTHETMLIVDGYEEGNLFFDESLQRFLFERSGCRVLITSCSGHSDNLKEMIGTLAILRLPSQKY